MQKFSRRLYEVWLKYAINPNFSKGTARYAMMSGEDEQKDTKKVTHTHTQHTHNTLTTPHHICGGLCVWYVCVFVCVRVYACVSDSYLFPPHTHTTK